MRARRRSGIRWPSANIWRSAIRACGQPSPRRARGRARSAAEMHSGFAALRNDMTMCIRERVDVRPWSTGLARDIARMVEIWDEGRARHGNGGAFLCGGFTAVDAFFCPVAFRFRTYGVTPRGAAGDYLQALLAASRRCANGSAAVAETESSTPTSRASSIAKNLKPSRAHERVQRGHGRNGRMAGAHPCSGSGQLAAAHSRRRDQGLLRRVRDG